MKQQLDAGAASALALAARTIHRKDTLDETLAAIADTARISVPGIDYAGISPLIALTAGLCVVLLSGVFTENRWAPTLLSLATLGAAAGLCIWQWFH